MAIKVKLRQKAISGGRQSLYLDYYPEIPHPISGEPTRRQFLNMYIYDNAKASVDKLHNKETLSRADFIRQQKENEINKPEIYTGFEKEQLRIKDLGTQSFFDYFHKLANKRHGSSRVLWESTLMHLKAFNEEELKFISITEKFCNDFRDFLLEEKITHSGRAKLSNNTAVVYLSKFKAVLRQAYKDGFLAVDINSRIKAIKPEETRRAILTLDEVNALIRTECDRPVIKQAAIFSIYTGLRFSDIQKLTWGEIEEKDADNIVINFKQQKTKGIETLPISKEAMQIIGTRGKDNEKVFDDLLYSAYYNKVMTKWIALAGITKPITFHSFRHTYATLQLTLGTDIYTVSKLLGHRDLKTTQIYAKIIDETKRTAANRIQLNITDWK